MISVLALAASAADPWSRGDYGKLSFASDHKSFTFSFASIAFSSRTGALDNVTATATSTGTDAALGAFDQLTLTVGSSGSLFIRYFAGMDAFVFGRAPNPTATDSFPSEWPSFASSGPGLKPNATRCLGWAEHFFFDGQHTVNDDGVRCVVFGTEPILCIVRGCS